MPQPILELQDPQTGVWTKLNTTVRQVAPTRFLVRVVGIPMDDDLRSLDGRKLRFNGCEAIAAWGVRFEWSNGPVLTLEILLPPTWRAS